MAWPNRRTSVVLNLRMKWDKKHKTGQVECMSYVPLYRTMQPLGAATFQISTLEAPAASAEYEFVHQHFGPLTSIVKVRVQTLNPKP